MEILVKNDIGKKYRIVKEDLEEGFQVSKEYILDNIIPIEENINGEINYTYVLKNKENHIVEVTHQEMSTKGVSLVPRYLFDSNNNSNALVVGRYYIKIKRKSKNFKKGIYQCVGIGVNSRGYIYGYFVDVLNRTNVKEEHFININSKVSLWCSNIYLINKTIINYLNYLKNGE